MNYLIGLGAFTLYADVVLLVVRTESQDTTSVLCNVCTCTRNKVEIPCTVKRTDFHKSTYVLL